ncbi:chloramphenicol O-acetyltransferase type A [Mucilaginibacter yixingensis]|uniref:Chloramphenicol O-acetyltransferase type A n=1 Tax=Mucilaginibacter yixingensis TaxID=1295612 RepID=A0A2T5JFN2_9SPHI|nr:CatA-like O-acetyltransferase [Mucilaginibacter yixingensis]PTR01233.1 chloramphenicol O-acetyltransferase type A [Mucilaginibacter yixingensis]
MKHKVDIHTWARKEHYNLFSKFEEPIYGVVINVDVTVAYQFAKANHISFFLYCMYRALGAAQFIEPFKYRIEDDEVFIYDRVDAASTVPRDNGTFGFGYFQYYPTLAAFMPEALKEMADVRSRTDLVPASIENIIRFSALPWIDFTSISHARMFSAKMSGPSISFGKMTEKDGRRTMPVSIHVHHALVDGLHIGQFIEAFQGLLNRPLPTLPEGEGF